MLDSEPTILEQGLATLQTFWIQIILFFVPLVYLTLLHWQKSTTAGTLLGRQMKPCFFGLTKSTSCPQFARINIQD